MSRNAGNNRETKKILVGRNNPMKIKQLYTAVVSIIVVYGPCMNSAWSADDQGIHVSGFEIYPSLSVSRTNDDNVFSQQDNPVEDSYLSIQPHLRILNDWEAGRIGLDADLESQRYADNSTQDRDDYRVLMSAQIEAAGLQSLEFDAAASRTAEDQNSSENFRGNSLIIADTQSLSAGYKRQAGWLGIAITGRLDTFDYTRDQSLPEDQQRDLRDRDENSLSARLGYGPDDSRTIYLNIKTGHVTHDFLDDDPSFNRDADFRETGVGFSFSDEGPLSVVAEVGGYLYAFDGDNFGDLDGIYHLAEVNWKISVLTRLEFSSQKSFQQTGTRQSAGYEETIHSINLKHDLTRDIQLSAAYEWGSDSYFNISREDDVKGYSLGAKYDINRYLGVFAQLSSAERTRSVDASGGTDDYTYKKQLITLGTVARF